MIIAAANLSIDAHPGLAAFYRTRVQQPVLLVLPRYLTITAASVLTLAAGTLAAWYETTILLGSVSLTDLAGGVAFEALWLCFVTSVVAAFTSAIRGVLGVVGSTLALLLTLALLGSVRSISSWMPTRLAQGMAQLIRHNPASNTWHAAILTAVLIVALVSLTVKRLADRVLDA